MIFNGTAMSVMGFYYLSRNHEIAKLMRFNITLDMIFGLVVRVALTGYLADIASRRMFVNYEKLK